jgi:glycosyltransferase involved in cell wall biosynthesis
MACGVPIVTSNLPTIESVPGVLLEDLRVDGLPTERAAAKVEAVLRLDGAERADLGARLRSVVVEDHSIERLFEKILDEIQLFEEAKKSPR